MTNLRKSDAQLVVSGTIRYEPNGYGGSMCHQGAGGHLHDDAFFKWWDRFGVDLQRLGPPSGYMWSSDDPITAPYWTEATIAENRRRREEKETERQRISDEMDACPFVACICGHHE